MAVERIPPWVSVKLICMRFWPIPSILNSKTHPPCYIRHPDHNSSHSLLNVSWDLQLCRLHFLTYSALFELSPAGDRRRHHSDGTSPWIWVLASLVSLSRSPNLQTLPPTHACHWKFLGLKVEPLHFTWTKNFVSDQLKEVKCWFLTHPHSPCVRRISRLIIVS